MDCPNCGFPLNPDADDRCPKCEGSLRGSGSLPLLQVDVAHDGESWEEAARKIEEAIDRGVRWGHKGVKIIHGRGAVIAPRAAAFMRSIAETIGARYTPDRNNPGASIVWLNR